MSLDITTLHLNDAGWEVDGVAGPRRIDFDPVRWAAASARLEPGAIASYGDLASDAGYSAWWADACGGSVPGVRRFLMRLSSDHWERPWEGTITRLDPVRWPDISLVRTVNDESRVPERAALDEPLRILWLKGASSGQGYAQLDLDAEVAGLDAARDSLDAAAKTRVSPIVRCDAAADILVPTLAEVRPNVLWFSGHGRADPPGLLMSDGGWLSADALADAVRQVGVQGVEIRYVVLWACRTGLLERFATPRAAPPFIDALARVGVSAILATQAPIADTFAQRLAAAIFSGLAGGLPLDHAIARARGAHMLHEGVVDDGWACPVIWAADWPADRLELAADMAAALRQDLARRLLPPDWAPDAPSPAAIAQGQGWVDHRIWVASPAPRAWEVRRRWLTHVLALQSAASRAVLVLDLETTTVVWALRNWADEIRRRVSHPEDSDKVLRRAAEDLREDPEAGWRALCARDDITLAFTAPETAPDWFWDALANARSAVALGANLLPEQAAQGWLADRLNEGEADQTPDGEFDAHLAALALLGAPAERIDIEAVAPGRLDDWLATGWAIETQAGFAMPYTRAEVLARRLDPGQAREAHAVAFDYLNGPRVVAKLQEAPHDRLRRARLAHAKAAQCDPAIVNAADALLRQYRQDHRWTAYRGVFDEVSSRFRQLDPCLLVAAGKAFIDTGAPADALAWLATVRPDQLEADCAAWACLLRAEALKASGQPGSKAEARKVLVAAQIEFADEPGCTPWRLRIRHDLAWLTHFVDHDPAAVLGEYAAIEQAWQALPHSGLDRAIVLRNLAEAQMTLASETRADAEALLGQADQNLRKARSLLPPNTASPLAGELEYAAGRLARQRGLPSKEVQSQFGRCLERANATSHLMLAAITEARLYWMREDEADGPFDPGGWLAQRFALQPYAGHGWAARVMINGDLRSAVRLQETPRMAKIALRRAEALLAANPEFNRGDDLRRRAVTFAGLALLVPDAPAWDQFRNTYDWADNWLQHREDTAEAVWQEGPP